MGCVVPGVQAFGQGADVDALGVQLLDGPQAFGEVPGQAVDPRDHHDVAGLELSPECRPPGAAHVPARGHVGEDAVVPEPVVGEDAALGCQPARALRLGDPDVAEDCGVHGVASGDVKKTSALPKQSVWEPRQAVKLPGIPMAGTNWSRSCQPVAGLSHSMEG